MMADRDTNNTQAGTISRSRQCAASPACSEYYHNQLMLNGLSPLERRLMLAFRFSIMAGKRDLDVVQMLQIRTGSLETAVQMSRLVKRLADNWEGPFLISPPCCQQMTSDEAVVIGMLRTAMTNDRAAFDASLSSMFSAPVVTDFWWLARATAVAALGSVT